MYQLIYLNILKSNVDFIKFVKDWKDSVGFEPFYKMGPVIVKSIL
jgi:hypothetical protein